MRKINKIIVHCSASPEGRDDSIEDIDRWHRGQGFSEIGYHYVIHLDGSIHAGRPVEKAGAHCSGHNENSIGVCYIGGLTKDLKECKDTRTEAQKKALFFLLSDLKAKHPSAAIYGHRDFSDKECPGFNAKSEYRGIR